MTSPWVFFHPPPGVVMYFYFSFLKGHKITHHPTLQHPSPDLNPTQHSLPVVPFGCNNKLVIFYSHPPPGYYRMNPIFIKINSDIYSSFTTPTFPGHITSRPGPPEGLEEHWLAPLKFIRWTFGGQFFLLLTHFGIYLWTLQVSNNQLPFIIIIDSIWHRSRGRVHMNNAKCNIHIHLGGRFSFYASTIRTNHKPEIIPDTCIIIWRANLRGPCNYHVQVDRQSQNCITTPINVDISSY